MAALEADLTRTACTPMSSRTPIRDRFPIVELDSETSLPTGKAGSE
jgi:hypothetical protein